jgi:hypothetical protein
VRESAYYLSVNRNKKSVVLDLKEGPELDKLEGLIRRADVLIENFRPGVMERLGLTEEALEALNPRLVVLSITGFGEGGPDGHRPGFDQIVQGESGLMSFTGPGRWPPTKVGVSIGDILAGMFGAFGVAASLVERDRSGKGQWVRTSLLGGMVAIHTFQGTRWLLAGDVPGREGNRHPLIAPYGTFRVADGDINVAVGSEGLWKRFAPLVGLDPDEPRSPPTSCASPRSGRLEEAMAPAFAGRHRRRLDGETRRRRDPRRPHPLRRSGVRLTAGAASGVDRHRRAPAARPAAGARHPTRASGARAASRRWRRRCWGSTTTRSSGTVERAAVTRARRNALTGSEPPAGSRREQLPVWRAIRSGGAPPRRRPARRFA